MNHLNEDSIKEVGTSESNIKSKSNRNILTAIIVVVIFGVAIFLAGKSGENFKESNAKVEVEAIDVYNGRFEIINEYTQSDGIDSSFHYYIAYDKVTKVIYVIGKAEGSSPTFTVMVGETGTPIRYAGKGDN